MAEGALCMGRLPGAGQREVLRSGEQAAVAALKSYQLGVSQGSEPGLFRGILRRDETCAH
jgi:hypothetical protein